MGSWERLLTEGATYAFEMQRVACDPLHGLQQEAGQRHAFTPVVCGDFLWTATLTVETAAYANARRVRLSLSRSLSHLEEVFKVGLVVDAGLQEHGSVDLAGAEADVGLHVRELGSQNVPDHLHRHVVTAHLFSSMQRPATWADAAATQYACKEQEARIVLKKKKKVQQYDIYFWNLVLHASSSFQLPKIMLISASFSRPESAISL